jgi:hypothetical protein
VVSDRSRRSRSRDRDQNRQGSREGDKLLDRNRDEGFNTEHTKGSEKYVQGGQDKDGSKRIQESTGNHEGNERESRPTSEGHGCNGNARNRRSRSRSRERPTDGNRDNALERKIGGHGRSWQVGSHHSDKDSSCRTNEQKPWMQDTEIGNHNSHIQSTQTHVNVEKMCKQHGTSSGNPKQSPAATDTNHSSLKSSPVINQKLSSTEALQLLANESQSTRAGQHADPKLSFDPIQIKKPDDAHRSSADGPQPKSSHRHPPSAQQAWKVEEVDSGCAVWQGRLGKASSDGAQVIW